MITIDFETYYDREYSLAKMTTEAYIRSLEFEVIGFAYQIDGSDPVWVADHANAVRNTLESLQLSNEIVLAHNAVFDAAILAWHYDIIPRFLVDTLSMARPFHRVIAGGSLAGLAEHYNLGSKGTAVQEAIGKRLADFGGARLDDYGEYCKQDTRLTYKLYQKLAPKFTTDELHSIDLSLRMFTDPVIDLDAPMLRKYADTIHVEKANIVRSIGVPKASLTSNPKFASVLESMGVPVPTKISATTGRETLALAKSDPEFQGFLESSHPGLANLARARLAVKSTIAETRAESLLSVCERGLLPVMLNYYGAHTGRFSGGDKLNLQNFPKRGGDKTLRQSIRAPSGCRIVACDLSQIEARVVAWLAGQQDLVHVFASKADVYESFAAKIFDKEPEEIDSDERFIGKTCVLGLGYGMGPKKLKDTFRVMAGKHVGTHDCETYVSTYRSSYKRVKELWQTIDTVLHRMTWAEAPGMVHDLHTGGGMPPILGFNNLEKCITLPSRLPLSYYNLESIKGELYFPHRRSLDIAGLTDEDKQRKWKKIYGGKGTENIVQALAAIILRWQMVQIHKHASLRPIFQVHDELVFAIPEANLDNYIETVVQWMRSVPEWAAGLPVDCEASIGGTYGDMVKLKL